jgi:hypothetical protein
MAVDWPPRAPTAPGEYRTLGIRTSAPDGTFPIGCDTQITLDGEPLRGVTRLDLTILPDGVVEATLGLIVHVDGSIAIREKVFTSAPENGMEGAEP